MYKMCLHKNHLTITLCENNLEYASALETKMVSVTLIQNADFELSEL